MLADAGASDNFPFAKSTGGYVRRIYQSEVSAYLSDPSTARTYTHDGDVLIYSTGYIVAKVWGVEIPEGKVPVIVKALDLPNIPVNVADLRFVEWVEGWRPFWLVPREKRREVRVKNNPRGKKNEAQ